MKKKVIYNSYEVLEILEDDGEIPHFISDGIKAISSDLDSVRILLMAIGIDVSKINQYMGITPPIVSNPVFQQISAHPNDLTVIRYAHFSTMPILNEDNLLLFNVRIKHYRELEGEEVYIPNEYSDKFKTLTANNDAPFVTLPGGVVMPEFDYLIWALDMGINIFDLMRSLIIQRDLEGKFNF